MLGQAEARWAVGEGMPVEVVDEPLRSPSFAFEWAVVVENQQRLRNSLRTVRWC